MKFRKSMTTKCKTRTRGCNLRIIMLSTSNVRMKRKRYRRPFSCRREKKPSNPRLLGVKMIRKSATSTSRLSKRTGWRTRLWINKNAWLVWRSKRRGNVECYKFRDSTKIGLATKRWPGKTRRRKLCRWRSLRWSSSRSSRIPRPFRRRRTKSLRKLSRSLAQWCYRMLRNPCNNETWKFSYLSESYSVYMPKTFQS